MARAACGLVVLAAVLAANGACGFSMYSHLPLAPEPPLCVVYEGTGLVHRSGQHSSADAREDTVVVTYNVREEVPPQCFGLYNVLSPGAARDKAGHIDASKRSRVSFTVYGAGPYKTCFSLVCAAFGSLRWPSKNISIDLRVEGFHSDPDVVSDPDGEEIVLGDLADARELARRNALAIREVEEQHDALLDRRDAVHEAVSSAYALMVFTSFISFVVLLGTAGVQTWRMKALLREKKAA